MIGRRLRGLVVASLVATLTTPGHAAEDLRSIERLSYRCESKLAQRDITLFANGTIRLRERDAHDDHMALAELAPEALQEILDRLAREDPSDDPFVPRQPGRNVGGDWVSTCELVVALPGRDVQRYGFSTYDTRSLRLSRLLGIAEELAAATVPEQRSDLPTAYWPEYGDVLLDADGYRWRVLWVTEDRRGVEMQGLDQPVRRIVAIEALRAEYVARVSSRDR